MKPFWEINKHLMFLDLHEYLSQKKFTGSRTAAFTCPANKKIIIRSGPIYFPMFLNKEMVIPHPFLRNVVVKFYLIIASESKDTILQVFMGMVA